MFYCELQLQTAQTGRRTSIWASESKYLVKGRGLKEKDVRRAIELSNTKFCSAAIMLGKTAEIVTSFDIEEDG